jgi:hypothetical protein
MNKLLLLLSLSAICLTQFVGAAPIVNGTDWHDTKGNPIASSTLPNETHSE